MPLRVLTHMDKRTSYIFYLCGDSSKASSRVRGYWVAEELTSRGLECCLESRHTKLALISFALKLPFYDVVIFQKTYGRWHLMLQRLATFLGKTTIFDLDDAPSRSNDPVTLRNVTRMLKSVSVVTVGSKALQTYADEYSNNVHLLPSAIRLESYQPVRRATDPDKVVCLGWIGNGTHYKRDLIEILRGPLTEVASRYPVRFKLIGACEEVELYEAFSNIPGLAIDLVDEIEWDDPKAVGIALQDIDVGLYPLLSNEFNRYKCGFKALEYMAMSIPVVSSRVAENEDIILDGETGLFAEDSEGWKKCLLQLIEDAYWRVLMGTNGRRIVEQRYSTQVVVNRLRSVLSYV